MPIMQANYRVTENDLLTVSRAIDKSWRYTSLFLIGIAIASAFDYASRRNDIGYNWQSHVTNDGLLLMALLLAQIIHRFVWLPRQVRRVYDLPAYSDIDRQITLAEDGIVFSEADSWSRLRWSRIISWYRSGSVIILRTRTPKRTFYIPCHIRDQGFDLDALTRALSHNINGVRS